jgi:TM2 domain
MHESESNTANKTSIQAPSYRAAWVAYLLLLLLGIFGAHRVYLMRGISAFVQTILTWSPLFLIVGCISSGNAADNVPSWLVTSAGVFSLIGVLWHLLDIALIPEMTISCNAKIRDMRTSTSDGSTE